MRKLTIIGISILSVFILCSLSYQPIIADTPIETISIAKKPKVSDLDADELKGLYNILVERKSGDDCGCGDTTEIFTIICGILDSIVTFYVLIIMLSCISPLFYWIGSLVALLASFPIGLAILLHCPWAPPYLVL